jgi:thiol:disulfide interchange protein DsbC
LSGQKSHYRHFEEDLIMLHRLLTITLVAVCLVATAAHANEKKLRAAIEVKFPKANIQSIEKMPKLDLYELVIDGVVYYSDAKFRYLLDGSIIEIKSMRNMTAERKREIEEQELAKIAIPFDDLPFNSAFKKVYGDGSRKMAYFADPNCGYCKRFDRDTLPKVKNTTVYVFMYPIIAKRSVPTSKAIWCSADPEKAWDDYVIRSVAPTAEPTCDNPVDDLLVFGSEQRIRGTPTLYFVDGSRVSGALTLEQLESRLTTAEEKRKKNDG